MFNVLTAVHPSFRGGASAVCLWMPHRQVGEPCGKSCPAAGCRCWRLLRLEAAAAAGGNKIIGSEYIVTVEAPSFRSAEGQKKSIFRFKVCQTLMKFTY